MMGQGTKSFPCAGVYTCPELFAGPSGYWCCPLSGRWWAHLIYFGGGQMIALLSIICPAQNHLMDLMMS